MRNRLLKTWLPISLVVVLSASVCVPPDGFAKGKRQRGGSTADLAGDTTVGNLSQVDHAREIIREAKLYFDAVIGRYNALLREVEISDNRYRQSFNDLARVRQQIMASRIAGQQDTAQYATLGTQEATAIADCKTDLGEVQASAQQATQLYNEIIPFPLYAPAYQEAGYSTARTDLPRLAPDLCQQKLVNPDLRYIERRVEGAGSSTPTPGAATDQDEIALAEKVKPAALTYLKALVQSYDMLVRQASDNRAAVESARAALTADEKAQKSYNEWAQKNPQIIAAERTREEAQRAWERNRRRYHNPGPSFLPGNIQQDQRRSRSVADVRARQKSAEQAEAASLDRARQLYDQIKQFRLLLAENFKEAPSRIADLPFFEPIT